MRTIGKSEHNLSTWKRAIEHRKTPSGDTITALEYVEHGTCVELWWSKELNFDAGVVVARGSEDPAFREELGGRPEGCPTEVGQKYCLRAPCIVYEHGIDGRHRVIVCETGVRTGPRRSERKELSLSR